jgi:Phosphate-selective porin O and P
VIRRLLLLGAIIAATRAGALSAQVIEAGGLKLKLGGRAQSQFSTTSVSAEELIESGNPPSSNIPAYMFEIRRLRLDATLDYQTWLSGKIELEFAMGMLMMRDAFINFGIDKAFQLKMGQFKKPFSMLQLYTSTKWPIIERGVRQRGLSNELLAEDVNDVLTVFNNSVVFGEEQSILEAFQYQNFDLGAVVHGSAGRFGYTAGVFNGPGSDKQDDTNGKSFGGRLTLLAARTAPLTLGAAVMSREFLVRLTPNIVTRGGVAYEADLEYGDFRKPGLHVLAEGTYGRNLGIPDTLQLGGKNFVAAQLVAAWFGPVTNRRIEGWELAGRVSWGNPRIDIDGDAAILLTPGFNVYFSGRNRFMVNLDVYAPTGSEFSTEYVVRSQAQIWF